MTFYDHRADQDMIVMTRMPNLLAMLLFLYFDSHLLLIDILTFNFDVLSVKIDSLAGDGVMMIMHFSDRLFIAGIKQT